VRSRTTPEFWKCFDALPSDVQRLAIRAFASWLADHRHPALHFKRIHRSEAIWSARIGIHWRVVGRQDEDILTWFWIGSHADYDRLLS
jgi:hypothetical protein